MQPDKSRLASGDTVVLDGLQAKPSLNGASGTLLQFSDGRWGVRLAGNDEKLRVKPQNLRPRLLPTIVTHDQLAASLRERHYAVCDKFLTLDNAHALHAMLQTQRAVMDEGDVAGGRAAAAYARIIKQAAPRGDLMKFFTPEEIIQQPALTPVLSVLDAAVGSLQASPLLHGELPVASLGRDEMQITCYPGHGARYVRHVDNNANNGRILTCILYANPEWAAGDGGELRLHLHDSHVVDVAPLLNRCVIFWSDSRVPHEVLPSHADRYALSIWYGQPQAGSTVLAPPAEKCLRPTSPAPSASPALATAPRVFVHVHVGGCDQCVQGQGPHVAPGGVVKWYQERTSKRWLCAACRDNAGPAGPESSALVGFVAVSLTEAAQTYPAADGDAGSVWMCCRTEGADVDRPDAQGVPALLAVARRALAKARYAEDAGEGEAEDEDEDGIVVTWDGEDDKVSLA